MGLIEKIDVLKGFEGLKRGIWVENGALKGKLIF